MHAHYNSMNNVNHIRTFYLLHAYILSSKISLPASLKTRNHWGFKQSVVLSTRELQARQLFTSLLSVTFNVAFFTSGIRAIRMVARRSPSSS